jgi:hypothetical protein
MKKIGIEINGVLRDTIGKFKQLYEQHMVVKSEIDTNDKTFNIEFSGDTEEIIKMDENVNIQNFEYVIKSDVTSLNLMEHFSFPSKDDLYSFMYEEYTMELFGHAPSTEMTTFNILNDLYYEIRENYDLLIVSDEIGKSKPSSLFFLSKFGCLLEKVIFYSEITKKTMWDEVDILLTSNPTLLLEKPKDKIVVKYNTIYNKQIEGDYEIDSLSEFKDIIKKIENYVPSV